MRKPIASFVLSGALSGALLFGQNAQMIVTVADHMSHKPVTLKAGDIDIIDATVIETTPLDAGKDLELFLLIDDAANYDFGSKLQELRRFIEAQPASVPVGIAYIEKGSLAIAEDPTTDRPKVIKALRPPSGSKAANPYCALSSLMEQWPKKTLRREIVLVSTGMDDTSTQSAVCVNAETTIHDAERAGVEIFALYNPKAGYESETWSKIDNGVTDLAHVCYETGGESYFQGHSPMDSIRPYLDDIAEHLAHQYLVKFRFLSGPGSNGLHSVFVMPGPDSPELMVPDSVEVTTPATPRNSL